MMSGNIAGRRRLRRAESARGYTAVEVLMAMAIMSIGAAAVMSMQKASIQGNLDARKTDVANSIARTWVERIHRDAMQWTIPGPTNPGGASNLAVARIVQDGANNEGKWFLPSEYARAAVPVSPGFDILGRDISPDDFANEPPLFCAHVRFVWLDKPGLLRADVRVLWARGISSKAVPDAPDNVCAPGVATSDQPDPRIYHAIYVTTAVKGNPI